MIPSWMIEDLERQRRERADRERPRVPLELPVRTEDEPPPRHPEPFGPIVIELGATHVLGERAASRRREAGAAQTSVFSMRQMSALSGSV